MDAFPAFFPLAGRTVVVAGEGEGAEAKVRLLHGSPAVIRRLVGAAAGAADGYVGAALAFIAGADRSFLEQAAAAARRAGAPVNVVDHPDLCDFTTPSVIDRGEVVAAIGTGGASPMLAAMLRHDIETRVPQGAGRVAALFRLTQDRVRAALPDPGRRRAFLRTALNGPAAQAAMAGDMAQAQALLEAALAQHAAGAPAAGRVRYLAAAGPADLLSLRAAAAMAQADVLVIDPGADAAILDLARRDALRRPAADVSPEAVVALAAAGSQVVRLLTEADAGAEQAALTQARVAWDILPLAADS